MSIKPIETFYNGYRFRSRLEARWAVFFDHCGIKYEYEPEGFALSDGEKYLPDFYLPEQDTYVEVKGIGAIDISFDGKYACFGPGREPAEKYAYFIKDALEDGHTVIMVQGDPQDALAAEEGKGFGHIFTLVKCFSCDDKECSVYPLKAFQFYGFCEGKIILLVTPETIKTGCFCPAHNVTSFCISVVHRDEKGIVDITDHINTNEEELKNGLLVSHSAALSARQARFEHGEAG